MNLRGACSFMTQKMNNNPIHVFQNNARFILIVFNSIVNRPYWSNEILLLFGEVHTQNMPKPEYLSWDTWKSNIRSVFQSRKLRGEVCWNVPSIPYNRNMEKDPTYQIISLKLSAISGTYALCTYPEFFDTQVPGQWIVRSGKSNNLLDFPLWIDCFSSLVYTWNVSFLLDNLRQGITT